MDEKDKEIVWKQIFRKIDVSGYGSLNKFERIWVNVDGLIGDVSGGGLISFFYNHGADNYDETIEDLDIIGADNAITLVNKISAMFPGGKPSRNIEERNGIIESWDHDELNDFFESLDDEFYKIIDDLEEKLKPIILKAIKLAI
jgi:hypothetical protein